MVFERNLNHRGRSPAAMWIWENTPPDHLQPEGREVGAT